MQTGLIVTTDDIDATHAELQAGGIDVDAAVAREGAPRSITLGAAEVVGPTPPMFYLRDPDGNALLLSSGRPAHDHQPHHSRWARCPGWPYVRLAWAFLNGQCGTRIRAER